MADRIILLGILLVAFSVRIGLLDSKGISYDEAATALMARAAPWEILQFHWNASFEHPPFWQLLMHFWSNQAGQSAWSLRFLPAGAGAMMIPLVWKLTRRGIITLPADVMLGKPMQLQRWPPFRSIAHATPGIASLLVAFAPLLVLYSQEARMYTIVSVLALAVLYSAPNLVQQPGWQRFVGFVLLHWTMLGFHYYSVLLVGAEVLYFGLVAWLAPQHWRRLVVSLLIALLPFLLWVSFAPGFRITAAIVLHDAGSRQAGVGSFLDQLWRDLSFGAIRWQPAEAQWGYGLLPLLLIGVGGIMVDFRPTRPPATNYPLILFALMFPLLFNALFFRSLATRYILFVLPLIYLLIAIGISKLWQFHWSVGLAGLAVALVIAGLGLNHYFGPYQKSEYQQMASYLTPRLRPQDGILLEAPRQHLLAKYYLPAQRTFYTAPALLLPDYWPISAPPVVPEEMDDQLQNYLERHHTLWLILTAQDEVDKGEFVAKYLQAVSFKTDCQSWLDVILCRFVSPHSLATAVQTQPDVRWNQELRLTQTTIGLDDEQKDTPVLLVTLDWQASNKPTLDYRVTLRLLDDAGNVLSQRDDFPIGNLLPPTTWAVGDEKPGYMALPLNAGLNPGRYQLVVGLYDPATGGLLPYVGAGANPGNPLLRIARVEMADKLSLHPSHQ